MFGSDSPSARAPLSARLRSFWCRLIRNPGLNVRAIIRSPWISRIFDDANPPISACRTLPGSAPAFDANSSASPTASIVSATMIWLATFVVCPSPLPPTRVMLAPIRSNSGLTVSNVAWLPPTMMVSLPALAPTSPPETGASRYSQPRALIRSAKPLVSMGEMELMSTTILPADRPSATPFSPNRTAATSGVSGTIVMMISERSATSLPLPQTAAPPSTSSCGIGTRSCTNNACSPVCRCPAMGRPMMPSPMKPTFAMSLVSLRRTFRVDSPWLNAVCHGLFRPRRRRRKPPRTTPPSSPRPACTRTRSSPRSRSGR